MALIFDIETVGADFNELDLTTRDSLTRWIRRQAGENELMYTAMLEDLKEGLGFSPLTGEIVAIGVYDDEKQKGVVYYQAPDREIDDYAVENFSFKARTEKEMLNAFWQGALQYRDFVSFNGRSFDAPFMLIRGAVNEVKPTIDLMSNRYLRYRTDARHIDLLDQMSFYGAVRRKGSLHLYCHALGIKSPKASGITGDDVKDLFTNKEYEKIAEYNSWDLIATAELYERWKRYIRV